MKSKDIQSIRKSSGLSQAGFANALGVSKRALQDWEQGRHEPGKAAVALLTLARERPAMFKGKAKK